MGIFQINITKGVARDLIAPASRPTVTLVGDRIGHYRGIVDVGDGNGILGRGDAPPGPIGDGKGEAVGPILICARGVVDQSGGQLRLGEAAMA